MNKNVKVWGFVAVLSIVVSGFAAAMASADITSESDVKFPSTLIYVPDNYTKIQWAVDNATDGDTIIVDASGGPYYENVVVNKRLSLIGIGLPEVNAGGSGSAITVTVDSCLIEGFNVTGSGDIPWDAGIRVESNSNILKNNTAFYNKYGIFLDYSNNNILSNNICNSNNVYGTFLFSSTSNTLTNNNNSNNRYGICLGESNDNTLTNNTMTNNSYNFGVYGLSLSDYIHDIDISNKVDGKPMYYLVNQKNKVLDASTNAGFVGVVNSTNITVKDLTLTNNRQGVLLAFTTNSKIENVNASNNEDGIYLVGSSSNTLTNNTCILNYYNGIHLSISSSNTLRNNIMTNNKYNFHVSGGLLGYYIHDIDTSNKVDGKPMYYQVNQNNKVLDASTNAGYVGVVNSTNITVKDLTLTNNYQGVFFAYTTNSKIENVNASNNERGISLFYSSNSILTNNTCTNNDFDGLQLFYTSNITIENNTCILNYNGISLHGCSDKRLIFQLNC